MATTTSTALGTSNLRGSSRQTRINPARTSRTSRTTLRQDSLLSNPSVVPPSASEPHGFYPAISHFTDAISALPRDYRRHTSLLKEVDAKAWHPEDSLQKLLGQCLIERQAHPLSSTAHTVAGSSNNGTEDAIMLSASNSVNGAHLDSISQYSGQGVDPALMQRRQMYTALRHNLMQMMITMDEKNHVINNANEDLSKHVRRLDGIWPHIAEEISEEARLGSLKHWAYTETNPVVKKAPAAGSRREAAASLAILAENDIAHRSESRREAMLAKKQRLNQHVESDFDDKAARKGTAAAKSRKAIEQITETIPIPVVNTNTAAGKRKKPEKPAGGIGMERSFSGARAGGVAMSRENSLQDNTKKRKAPPAAATVARKRINAAVGDSPKLASSPLANTNSKDAVKRSPALSSVRPVARGRQNSTNSEHMRNRQSSFTSKIVNGAGTNVNSADSSNSMTTVNKNASETKNVTKELMNNRSEKTGENNQPANNESAPPTRGGVALERAPSKQGGPKKELNNDDKGAASPRLSSVMTAVEPRGGRGRASKTSTPVVSTFAEAEAEESTTGNGSENGTTSNANSKPKRAPRPRMKDHHGLHDSLSPKGLPMKRTHGKNASFSSLNALQQLTTSKPTSSRTRDRDRNQGDTEKALSTTSRSTSRNQNSTHQHSQNHPSTSTSSASLAGVTQDRHQPTRGELHASPSDIDSDGALEPDPEPSQPDPDPENDLDNEIEVDHEAEPEPEPDNDNDNENENENDNDIENDADGDADEEDELRYCYCNGVSYGEMVACDNKNCPREWFHLSCLGLKSLPKSAKWYCDECKDKFGGVGRRERERDRGRAREGSDAK